MRILVPLAPAPAQRDRPRSLRSDPRGPEGRDRARPPRRRLRGRSHAPHGGAPRVSYLEHPNQPVGAKWNAGAHAARELRPDAGPVVGSDDIVSTNLLPRCAHPVAAGADLVAVRDNYFWDLRTGALLHREGYEGARRDEPIGAARLLTSPLLDRLDWTPWSPTLDRGLDLSMWDRIGALSPAPRLDVVTMHGEDIAVVDVKSDVNICAFERVRRAPKDASGRRLRPDLLSFRGDRASSRVGPAHGERGRDCRPAQPPA